MTDDEQRVVLEENAAMRDALTKIAKTTACSCRFLAQHVLGMLEEKARIRELQEGA